MSRQDLETDLIQLGISRRCWGCPALAVTLHHDIYKCAVNAGFDPACKEWFREDFRTRVLKEVSESACIFPNVTNDFIYVAEGDSKNA